MPRLPQHISDPTFKLLLAEGVGPATLRKLRERFNNNDDEIAGASCATLELTPGIGRDTAQALRRAIDAVDVDAERKVMASRQVSIILQGDEDYPALLATIDQAPAALWIRGRINAQDRLSIAVVGSRKCTAYGREQASRFASLLAQSGLTIVSGGAVGVDGEAHRAAMRVGGRTIVVAGCGLATDYPPEHTSLYEKIVQDDAGAIISEFAMDTPPAAGNFPRRNRIISGLSLGVLVIEAALRSGALITARMAAEDHNREVMALPGRVDSPASAGCLKAIREGWAALVISHADVLAQLDASSQLVRGAVEAAGQRSEANGASLFDESLTPAQQSIVRCLEDAGDALLVEQISSKTDLPLSQIMAEITILQIRGRVTKNWSGTVSVKRKLS